LLERSVLLESLPAVEEVTSVESSAKAREKGVSKVKINIAEQSTPSASMSKTV